MKKVATLLIAIAACAAFTAACSKSDNSSSNTAATASADSVAVASAVPAMPSPRAGHMGGAAAVAVLPIPLAKLPSEKVGAGDVASGAKIFSANCESCHGAGGKNGTVGPTLAGAGLKAGQVAEMVEYPQAVDKESGMPNLHLTKQQVADVAAYVASLK